MCACFPQKGTSAVLPLGMALAALAVCICMHVGIGGHGHSQCQTQELGTWCHWRLQLLTASSARAQVAVAKSFRVGWANFGHEQMRALVPCHRLASFG